MIAPPGTLSRRIAGTALTDLLAGTTEVADADLGEVDAAPPNPAEDKPTVSAAPVVESATSEEPADETNGDGS